MSAGADALLELAHDVGPELEVVQHAPLAIDGVPVSVTLRPRSAGERRSWYQACASSQACATERVSPRAASVLATQ